MLSQIKLTIVIICFIIVGNNFTAAQQSDDPGCRSRNQKEAAAVGKSCTKHCENHSDCEQGQRCMCARECGFSCVDLTKECATPANLDHTNRFTVYRKNYSSGCYYLLSDNDKTYKFDDKVNYKCQTGFEITIENAEVYCTARSSWTNDGKKVCQPRGTCLLPQDHFARKDGLKSIFPVQPFFVGRHRYRYNCPGFQSVIAFRVRTCLPTGRWSGLDTNCGAMDLPTTLLPKIRSSIEKVANEIKNCVPDWSSYEFEEDGIYLNENFKNTSTKIFEYEHDQFDHIMTRRFLSESHGSSFNYTKPVSSTIEVSSLLVQPYVFLMWFNDKAKREDSWELPFKINFNLIPGKYSNGSGEIKYGDLTTTYYWRQTHNESNLPSICKVAFMVEGGSQSWTSGKLAENIRYSILNYSKVNLSLPDFHNITNTLLGVMILSRRNGTYIENKTIDKAVKVLTKALPQVFCNPQQQPCNITDPFDCRCGPEVGTQILSPNLYCIPSHWRCDGIPDCPNGKDEDGCICEDDQFQCGCKHGGKCDYRFRCISKSKLCDGNQDCENYSDEAVGSCAFNCSEETKEAVRNVTKCNGIRDCSNYKDEHDCPECPDELPHRCECNKEGDFTCNSTTTPYACYSDEQRCDGVRHCSDFSDEWNCSICGNNMTRCNCNQMGNFSCEGNHSCYNQSERCNLNIHCADGTDELSCTHTSCPNNEIPCDCNRYNNMTCKGEPCYEKDYHNDGWIDCSDGSDEENETCPTQVPNRCNCVQDCVKLNNFSYEGKIIFYAFSCYSVWDECDGVEDCSDGSDENVTTCQQCTEYRPFKCEYYDGNQNQTDNTSKCFTEKERCDGTFDCYFGSDEWNCSCPGNLTACACRYITDANPLLDSQRAVCDVSNETCHLENETCDGFDACPGWTDELQCDSCPEQFPWNCDCNQGRNNNSCKGRSCIKNETVCDGQEDCSDGSDESDCSSCTPQRPHNCSENAGIPCYPDNAFEPMPSAINDRIFSNTADSKQIKDRKISFRQNGSTFGYDFTFNISFLR